MTVVEVPISDAPLDEVFTFASMSYDGYGRHGGLRGLQAVGRTARQRWASSGELPRSLDEARAALFFEARAAHFGWRPEVDDERYVRQLLVQVSVLSGGVVSQDDNGAAMRLRRWTNRFRGRE